MLHLCIRTWCSTHLMGVMLWKMSTFCDFIRMFARHHKLRDKISNWFIPLTIIIIDNRRWLISTATNDQTIRKMCSPAIGTNYHRVCVWEQQKKIWIIDWEIFCRASRESVKWWKSCKFARRQIPARPSRVRLHYLCFLIGASTEKRNADR